MPSLKKDIGLGLLAGMGFGGLLIGGMFLVARIAPLPEFVPAAVQEVFAPPTAQASQLPTPRIHPNPSATPLTQQDAIEALSTPVLMEENLISGNPLTSDEQAQLYYAALTYVATDFATIKANGERINGVGYGHPSNICGPLAIAILKDAYILGKDVVPYHFWLLNPDVKENRARLEETFPAERFENWRDTRSLNKIDWREFPLMPGDFLYLYSGSRGNFEHMLVVTRVDEDGRAYSVTNYNTEDGFVVSEALLYDPNNPGEGFFYEWTAREKALLGSTGFNGFELWRLRQK